MTPVAPHIAAFLRERITSENTRATYAYAFQLLFTFASKRLGVAPSDLQIEHLDAPLVLAFLAHVEQDRGNGAATRNTRLAAVRSFMRFIEHRLPAALDQIRRVLAIPQKRKDTRLVKHLSVAESRAVLDAPDPASRLGIRDRAMLYLGLTGGLRVSELVGLRLDDVQFQDRYVEIRVRGKGRKERALLLWKQVGDAIRAWLAIRGQTASPELFVAATSHPDVAVGLRICAPKTHPHGGGRLPIAGCEKHLATHAPAHLCAGYPPGDRRSPKGVALAWPRQPVHHRDLPAGRSDREDRNGRVRRTPPAAPGAIPANRPAPRVAHGEQGRTPYRVVSRAPRGPTPDARTTLVMRSAPLSPFPGCKGLGYSTAPHNRALRITRLMLSTA